MALTQVQKINFFDEISANKHQSLFLIFFMFILYLVLIFVLSELFDFGIFGILLGFFVLVVYAFATYYIGSDMILGMSGAKQVLRENYPFLFLTVEGLAAANGIKPPNIYVIQDPSPNAFVVGRDPEHSSLAVTSSLLEVMDKNELTAVLAHEMSHIATYDIRFMLFSVVFAGSIAMLSDMVWRSMRYGGGRDRKGSGLLFLIAIVLVVLAPIFSELIRFAISRKREYLADANGARMTRQPQYLASALEKIEKIKQPVAAATDATAPLYFSMPTNQSFFHLFSTHPPIEERIKKLREMA